MSLLSLIFKGGLIGIANIIPGVSGGTMAMVLGIYERMIRSLNCIGIGTNRCRGSVFDRWRCGNGNRNDVEIDCFTDNRAA